jgi:hypothetical protein
MFIRKKRRNLFIVILRFFFNKLKTKNQMK